MIAPTVSALSARSCSNLLPYHETAEHFDNFAVDGNGYGVETPTYDPAGNLTYDGNLVYTYDAWNRLVSAGKGYRDGSGTLQAGGTFVTMAYDGRGRRIRKTVDTGGDLSGLCLPLPPRWR